MILEGLITTLDADGSPHLAPMGPSVEGNFERLLLRPFPTSHTYRNLARTGMGVLHVVDDVVLLAKAAVGKADVPPGRPAERIDGCVLLDACRAYEFRISSSDAAGERARLEADVLAVHRLRDFWGFNRGKHAVVEAAILATRLHLLDRAEVAAEFRRLKVWVEKTGGPAEEEAFAFLEAYAGVGA